jgi:hypothetical protein
MSGFAIRKLALAFLLTALLGACGTPDAKPSGPIARGAVLQQSGNVSVKVTPAEFSAGQTVTVTVTLSGPMYIHYKGCVPPLELRVTDPNGDNVWDSPNKPCIVGEAGPPVGVHFLAAGQTETISDVWPSSAHLANGTYRLHATFYEASTSQGTHPIDLPWVKVKIVSS